MHIQNNLILWYIIVTCLFIIRILLLCYRPNLYHALKTVILKTPFITLPTLGNLCFRANSWTKKWALFKKIFRFARYKSAQFDTLVLHSYRTIFMIAVTAAMRQCCLNRLTKPGPWLVCSIMYTYNENLLNNWWKFTKSNLTWHLFSLYDKYFVHVCNKTFFPYASTFT